MKEKCSCICFYASVVLQLLCNCTVLSVVFFIVVSKVIERFVMVVVKENEQIRLAVKDGQRPDLSVITGPETLTPLLVDLISRCWHQNPDERPAFSGMSCMILYDVLF